MPFQLEFPPVPEERLRATAEWIQHNVHPIANLVGQPENGEPPQPFEVRDHQVEALAREWEARKGGQERTLGHLATGGGKTTIAVIDAMKYREECAQMDPPMIPRYLYVSHKHEINEQAAERFRRFIPDADIEFFDTRKAANRPDADFTFATIQSLYSQLHTFDPEDFEKIFWDEAHHLEAKTFKQVLEYFRPLFESAATATVERMDRKDIRDYWGEAIFSKGLPDGIAEGWLADIEYHLVFDKAVKEEVAEGFNPKTLKEIEDLFEKKVSTEALANSIKEEIEKLGLKDPKTLVFCESVEEADEMAPLLGGVPYHSYTEDRPKILQGLKSGTIKVVTAKDMFNEGVDVPDVEVVAFLRATKSGPLFEQQLGRGLRKIPGKDKVYVLDFVANIERIAKVRELSDAVQKAVGDKDGTVDVTDNTSCGGGITIHSKHSEFDFDTMAVDLLEKWGRLKEGAPPSAVEGEYEVAPEGWQYTGLIAESLGRSRKTILQIAEELGLEGVNMVGESGHVGLYFSTEQATTIAKRLGAIVRAPEDWLSVVGLKGQFGISLYTTKSTAQKLGIQGTLMHGRGGQTGVFYSPDEQKRILASIRGTESQTDEWMTETAIADSSELSQPTVKAIIRELGIQGKVMKNEYGHRITCYSSSQQADIRAAIVARLARRAPEGWMTGVDIHKQYGIDNKVVTRRARDLGILGSRKTNRLHKEATYYSPDEIRAILDTQ